MWGHYPPPIKCYRHFVVQSDHVTLHDVIFADIDKKKMLKTADVSKNWGCMGQWNIIRKELCNSNKLSS